MYRSSGRMGSADSSAESLPATRADGSAVWASAMGIDPSSLEEHGDQGLSDEMQFKMRSSRLDALAGFESFIQDLDDQPQAYGLEEFIRGAANAFQVGIA